MIFVPLLLYSPLHFVVSIVENEDIVVGLIGKCVLSFPNFPLFM